MSTKKVILYRVTFSSASMFGLPANSIVSLNHGIYDENKNVDSIVICTNVNEPGKIIHHAKIHFQFHEITIRGFLYWQGEWKHITLDIEPKNS